MAEENTRTDDSANMILILGETGVGKSTFINAAGPSGRMAAVGHSLESCTLQPEGYLIEEDNRRVILVDTPGFNDSDTARTADYILRTIITWLQNELRKNENARLAGIIYLHDITNIEGRVPKLVDASTLHIPPSVILATVQCHGGPIPDHRRGKLRERYPNIFTGDHFGQQDQQASALALIDKVIESRTPAPLSSVIEKLQRLVGDRILVKWPKFFVWRILHGLFSSFRN